MYVTHISENQRQLLMKVLVSTNVDILENKEIKDYVKMVQLFGCLDLKAEAHPPK